jgi:ADP-dependent NAD(P)H-hydrate dehydratase / NAD(P)H-hydrate epimerase
MYVVTSQEMRSLDQYTIDVIGIPSIVLMENAGRAVAERIIQSYPGKDKRWLIMVGKGNNGGDGLVTARHLADAGFAVEIVFAVDPANLQGDAAVQRDVIANLGLPIFQYDKDTIEWNRYEGIVDALFGTGSRGAPKEPYASMIRQANRSGCKIVSIDIPSGLDSDTGRANDPCIRADMTVTLAFAKRGLSQFPGRALAGHIFVVPIGIPAKLPPAMGIQTIGIDPVVLHQLGIVDRLKRQSDTHKGSFGHVLVVAGSKNMSGAGILCCKSALRAGCGLVTWAIPEYVLELISGSVPEIMYAPIPGTSKGEWVGTDADSILALAEGKSAVVIGPGIGRFAGGNAWLRKIWEQLSIPLVVDADGLNLLAEDFENWQIRKASTILTPHPGEMARLIRRSTQEVQENRIEIAKTFATKHQLTVVLKGAGTVIATKDGHVYVNPTGNPGMATAGTGDTLAGIIASLLAQSWTTEQAVTTAVYIHGIAGDLAFETYGNSLIASDLIDRLGDAFQSLHSI